MSTRIVPLLLILTCMTTCRLQNNVAPPRHVGKLTHDVDKTDENCNKMFDRYIANSDRRSADDVTECRKNEKKTSTSLKLAEEASHLDMIKENKKAKFWVLLCAILSFLIVSKILFIGCVVGYIIRRLIGIHADLHTVRGWTNGRARSRSLRVNGTVLFGCVRRTSGRVECAKKNFS